MNNIYDEEGKKFAGMIQDLKNLPRIEAPENFEYNLMTRIQNKNFGTAEKEKIRFNWIKFLAPSAAVVTAAILFFIFIPSNQQIDNPLSTQSKKIDSQSIAGNSDAVRNEVITRIQPGAGKNKITQDRSEPGASQPAGAFKSGSLKIPFGYTRSVSLDDYISGANNRGNLERGNVVNSGDAQTPFDGFFIVEKPDQSTLKRERARIDSVKNARAKADSLKKVQKLP
jgi:hypothetical protein